VFVILQFIIVPTVKKRSQLKKSLHIKTKEYSEFVADKSEYDSIKQRTELYEASFSDRDKGFTLSSFINNIAGKTGIKDRISSMRPSSSVIKESGHKISMVEMKLQAVSLNSLSSFLYMLETSNDTVFIKKISISLEGRGKKFINAVLQVETVEM